MRSAYAMSGLTPEDISFVECQATGTAVGDGAEIQSMTEVFGRETALPIGSLKANLGHSITVSGVNRWLEPSMWLWKTTPSSRISLMLASEKT